jgi:two-component system, cell cycle response regulator CtrA
MRVLLVEENQATAASLLARLVPFRVDADMAGSPPAALELLRTYDYDAVVLQSEMPGAREFAFLRSLRGARPEIADVPVLVVTSVATAQRVALLDAGADDVLPASVDPGEIAARLRAVVRRGHGFCRSAVEAGGAVLDMAGRTLTVDGERLHLAPREYALLELLFLRRGVVQGKAAVMNHLYGASDGPELKAVDVLVCKLRKKLAQAGVPDLVCTVWGSGYVLRETHERDMARIVGSHRGRADVIPANGFIAAAA